MPLPVLLCSITRESPRWLVLKGKIDEAKVILERVAKVNGKEMLIEPLHYEPDKQVRMGDLRDLFMSWKMAHKTLLSWYLWLVNIDLITKFRFRDGLHEPGWLDKMS